MQIPQITIRDEVWIKILPKGLITLPKKMREKLNIKAGDIAKIKIIGKNMVIEPKETVKYRLYSDKEIDRWVKDDKLPAKLAKKANAIWADIP